MEEIELQVRRKLISFWFDVEQVFFHHEGEDIESDFLREPSREALTGVAILKTPILVQDAVDWFVRQTYLKTVTLISNVARELIDDEVVHCQINLVVGRSRRAR
jgi:hypothetical protein